MELSMDSSSKG
uniref:Uncharacterized protein n=1 Tax=Rhizophora mucronata TaxID=61149 RepID=A0A2P2NJL5_RHIMU